MLNKRASRGKTLTRWCTCLCFRHPHSARAEKWCHRVVWLNPRSKWWCAPWWKRTLYNNSRKHSPPTHLCHNLQTVNATADHTDMNPFSQCFTTMQSLDRLSILCDIVYKSLTQHRFTLASQSHSFYKNKWHWKPAATDKLIMLFPAPGPVKDMQTK